MAMVLSIFSVAYKCNSKKTEGGQTSWVIAKRGKKGNGNSNQQIIQFVHAFA